MKYLNSAYYIVLFFLPKMAKCKIFSQFFSQNRDSIRILKNSLEIYMWITKITFVLMSGFYLDYKKRKPGFYRDYKKPRKMAMGFYMDSKKTQRKVVWRFRFFFSGFFGILRDSTGFWYTFWSYLQLWGGGAGHSFTQRFQSCMWNWEVGVWFSKLPN